jgi:hypothetical protein
MLRKVGIDANCRLCGNLRAQGRLGELELALFGGAGGLGRVGDGFEPGRRCDVLERLLVLTVDRSDRNAARSPSWASSAILLKNP